MEQKNLLLAIAISLVILLGWQFFIVAPQEQQRQAALQRQQEQADALAPDPGTAPRPGQAEAPGPGDSLSLVGPDRAAIVERSQRVAIETPELPTLPYMSGRSSGSQPYSVTESKAVDRRLAGDSLER